MAGREIAAVISDIESNLTKPLITEGTENKSIGYAGSNPAALTNQLINFMEYKTKIDLKATLDAMKVDDTVFIPMNVSSIRNITMAVYRYSRNCEDERKYSVRNSTTTWGTIITRTK